MCLTATTAPVRHPGSGGFPHPHFILRCPSFIFAAQRRHTGGSAGLPHTYGLDDIPLILQDYAVGGGGLGDAQANENVRTGPLLVNGALAPALATAQARLRLRLLNGSARAALRPILVAAARRRGGRR